MTSPSPIVAQNQAEPPLIVALDIGTSSVRSLLFDRFGRSLENEQARRSLKIKNTVDGGAEIDPDILIENVFRCLDEIVGKAGAMAKLIGGVATCTFVNNIMGIERGGRPITPVIAYSDTRAQSDAERLKADLDETSVRDRTGCPIHSSYLPARFCWLASSHPDLFRQVARWISVGEYLELKLFGRTAVSYSVASWTGLLDRRRLVWDEQILERLPVNREQLSALTDVNVPRRGLLPSFAKRWPALEKVPWFPALGDGAAANVGSGCTSPTRVAITVGTSSAVRSVVSGAVGNIPDGLWCYRVDRTHSLPGGALSEGGNIFGWAKATLNLGEPQEIEYALRTMEPDAHGLTILPFFAGERSPGWAGRTRATIQGLSLASTPLDILRAGLESVAYRIATIFELLCQILPPNIQIIASGAALRTSPAWMQILADVMGHPVAASLIHEVSARGAALLALEALGKIKDLGETPDFVGMVFDPETHRHNRYRAAMDRQHVLYKKMVK